jgi:hypothetical protein
MTAPLEMTPKAQPEVVLEGVSNAAIGDGLRDALDPRSSR